jgi:restriction endonuclease S subunit
MGRYKPYERYKDSGVEWIGEVPEHWEVKKFSWLFGTIGSGTTPNSQNESYYDGNINWVVTGELIDGEIGITNKQITESALRDYSALNVFEPGTILMALYGATIGKLGILCVRATTNQACCAMANPRDNVNPLFVYYWLLGLRQFIISLSYGGGQPNISQQVVRNLRISLPPNNEQQAIADFLDQKTSEIDCLVADREKLVSLLQEYRQAIISEAVTKGLNPDVNMKDSGVEWIGEIPEHWSLSQVRKHFDICLGKMLQPEKQTKTDTLEKYLCSVNIISSEINLDVVKEMWFSSVERSKYEVVQGDLLVCEGGDVGKVALWDGSIYPCYIQNALHRIRPLGDNSNMFLMYWFIFLKTVGYIEMVCNKATMAHFTREKVARTIFIVLPSIEQQAIADYLDQKTAEIDNLISGIQESIDQLKSYRQSLISEAVTGKIDVRGVI